MQRKFFHFKIDWIDLYNIQNLSHCKGESLVVVEHAHEHFMNNQS
jgi:hypothetical protein